MPALIALLLVLVLPPGAWANEPFLATVTRISDGDTFTVQRAGESVKIRVYGVDCPEIEQPQGVEAKAFILELLPLGASVRLLPVDVDRYGRVVAVVYLPNDSTLQDALIQVGYAWVYGRYCARPECGAWVDGENAACRDGVGLWAMPAPVPPWEWRKGAR